MIGNRRRPLAPMTPGADLTSLHSVAIHSADSLAPIQPKTTKSAASQAPNRSSCKTSVEEFVVSIPSDTAAGLEVQERIVALLESMKYPARDVFGIRLALEEALVNAIKHGNGMDLAKQVRVSCRVCPDVVRVEIEDEGAGFRLEDVPDPTDDGNLERASGRGIMLMKHFLNCVEYNDVGNKVLLEKCRGEDNE